MNTLADGFFHLVTWFVVVGASIVALAQWRQGTTSATTEDRGWAPTSAAAAGAGRRR
ncbi:hypothetical protein Pve01_86020 [Planomonospora venezuelensis]|nr:hypothetical protein Pve01_86020 [Planomonospora venezuelensis]